MASLPFPAPPAATATGGAVRRIFPPSAPEPPQQDGGETNDPSSELDEAITRILEAAEQREAALAGSAPVFQGEGDGSGGVPAPQGTDAPPVIANRFGCDGGPLTAQEVSHLSMLCASLSQQNAVTVEGGVFGSGGTPPLASENGENRSSKQASPQQTRAAGGWADVDGDELAALTPMLEAHVASASSVDLVGEARAVVQRGVISIDQWLQPNPRYVGSGDVDEPGTGFHRLSVLRRGLEAASILLCIMNSPGVDRRAVGDDGIEASVSLMKQHLQRNIVPALAGTGHAGRARAGEEQVKSPPARKRTKVSANQDLIRAMKKLYKPILASVGLASLLMERMDTLIQTVQLDDQPLLTICSAALSTLSVDPAPSPQNNNASLTHLIQIAGTGLVASVFRRYSRHRTIIIEDLFPLMLQLPTSKRSLRTFPIRAATAPNNGNDRKPLLSPISSPKPPSDQSNIQVITNLILTLIQGCVFMPYASAESSDSEELDQGLPRLVSGVKECQSVCDIFTAQMVQRCSRKGEEGGASEFRPILANLVEDLLAVQLMPEYPAAEMLLLALCRRLSHDLVQSSSVSGSRNGNAIQETTYLATAMDTIGKITSAVAGHIQNHREHPLKLPDAVDVSELDDGADPGDESEVNRCFCGRRNLMDTFMIDCDRCHGWFHGSCVGILKDALPEVWYCDECTMQTMALEQAQAFAARRGMKMQESDRLSREVSETHIFRQLLLNSLSHLCETTQSSMTKTSREFQLATWIHELDEIRRGATGDHEGGGLFDADMMLAHFMEQWSVSPGMASSHSTQPKQRILSAEGNVRIRACLAATSGLASSFARLLGVLLSLMGDDDSPSLRKLAVKGLAQVVNVDPSLMVQPSVQKAVSRRFLDESISVREAAVSLVGDYVLQSPQVAKAFHSSLLSRVADVGVSVRKRAVKIFRDILMSNPTYGGRASACNIMLQRAADRKEDDGVRDLIHDTFQSLWFESGSSCSAEGAPKLAQSALVGSSGPIEGGVLAGASASDTSADLSRRNVRSSSRRKRGDSSNAAAQRCNEAAKQMVEVVATSGSSDYLTSLVKDLLFGLGEGSKAKKAAERRRRQEAAQRQCSNLVSALIEQLLSFEENRTHQGDEEGRTLVALMSTLAVFAEASPELLSIHLDTLLPYLKGDNSTKKYDTMIVCCVSKIISRVTPRLTGSDVRHLTAGDLCTDLVNITYKYPSGAVGPAVEALTRLVAHQDADSESPQAKKLLKLAAAFYGYLYKTKDATNDLGVVKASVRNNVHRALTALGALCRFFEHHEVGSFHRDRDDPTSTPLVEDTNELAFENHVLSNACYGIFAIYLEKNDAATKCKALRAMTGVFISRPRVMLAVEHTGILTDVMSENAPPELQIEALRCWRDILLAEERRIESGQAKEEMDSKHLTVSKRISGDQDSDSTLVGGVLTAHADRLYEMTTCNNERIRYMVVDLIGHLLRQGLINPMETVPYLLALQGDVGSSSTRSLALKLLITEGDKRPDMLRQRVCAGVKQAYKFQRSVYPERAATALLPNVDGTKKPRAESIFDSIFMESIRRSKVQRQGLYKSLLTLFESGGSSEEERVSLSRPRRTAKKEKAPSFAERLPLLVFASQLLAHLPYNTLTDPLFIVYHTSCLTALDGAQLLSRFASLLADDDVDDPNTEEDDLERAAKTKNPSRAKAADVLNATEFDIEKFCEFCAEGSALVLLLRLNSFLRRVYNLSEARIAEYLPNEKERLGDKGISAPEFIPTFPCQVERIFRGTSGDGTVQIDKDAAIRQYAEFRRLMRSMGEHDLLPPSPVKKQKSGRKRGRPSEGGEENDAVVENS